jgi:hypothetical protein
MTTSEIKPIIKTTRSGKRIRLTEAEAIRAFMRMGFSEDSATLYVTKGVTYTTQAGTRYRSES